MGPALLTKFEYLARAGGATRLKAMLDSEPKGRALRERRSKMAGFNEVEGDAIFRYKDLISNEDRQ